MTWYTAHLVTHFRFKDGLQDSFPVQENLVLIEAATSDQAMAKAEAAGRAYEGDSEGTLRYGGRPATLVFAGVRRLIRCVDPENQPTDGTEVSYQDLVLASEEDLRSLVAGEEVVGVTLLE